MFRSGIASLCPKIKFKSVANFDLHLLIISGIFKKLSFMINVHFLSPRDVLFFSQNSCSSWIEDLVVIWNISSPVKIAGCALSKATWAYFSLYFFWCHSVSFYISSTYIDIRGAFIMSVVNLGKTTNFFFKILIYSNFSKKIL
jgi:hypothetical protein